MIVSIQELYTDRGIHLLPCEIGITVGTVAEGEKASFHCLVDPEPVPLSYLPSAMWGYRHVHGIATSSIAANAPGERNLAKVCAELNEFIIRATAVPGAPPTRRPLVFAKGPSNAAAALQWLVHRARTS